MDIISWIKTTLSKYNSNNTHDKNAIYFVKNEDGKTGKIISDEVVYGNGGGANGVVVESSNQPTGGESVWVNPDEDPEEVEVYGVILRQIQIHISCSRETIYEHNKKWDYI